MTILLSLILINPSQFNANIRPCLPTKMIFETPWFIYHVWILEKRATRWRWWPSLTIFLGLPDQAACRLRHQQQLQIIKNWSFGIIYKLFQFHHRHYDFKYHMVSQKMLFKFSVMYSFIHSPFSFLPLHVLATFTLVNKIPNSSIRGQFS